MELKMAKISLVFFLLVFILAISGLTTVKGKICEKPSKTWSGKCSDNKKCDKQCIDWEDAKHGACQGRESAKDMCYCYFDCDPKKPSPSPSPPPPKGGEPPAKGGEPPPPSPPPPGGEPPPAEGGQPPPPPYGGEPPPAEGGQPPPAEGGQPPPA